MTRQRVQRLMIFADGEITTVRMPDHKRRSHYNVSKASQKRIRDLSYNRDLHTSFILNDNSSPALITIWNN